MLYQRKVIGVKTLEDDALMRLVASVVASNYVNPKQKKDLYFFGMFCMTPGAGFIRTQYSYEMSTDPRIVAIYGADRIGFGFI